MPARGKARFHLRVWISVIAIAFVFSASSLCIITFDNVRDYRNLDQKMAESNVLMTSKAYSEYVLRIIQKIDQTSQIILSEYREGHAPLDSIVKSASSIIMPEYLFQVSVVNKNGFLIFSNLSKVTEPIDLSDREHFRIHLEDKRDFLYISKPVLGRVSRKWSIQFTRKIINKQGEFDGVIVLSVDPSYLANFSNSVLLGERDAIGLSRYDGAILSRVVGGIYQEQYFGTVIGSRPYMSALAPDAGVYEAESPVDGVQRFVGYQKLRDYGLVAVALFDKEAAFARSDQALSTAYLIVGAGTFLLALASLASALAIRAVLHEYVIEQTMNAELRTAHDELAVAHACLKMREEELVVLSETDPLCRIANRRRFMTVADAELIRHRRYRRIFSLLILDVDHFKAINDTHGHGVGDAVLVALANTIKTRLRETDTFARIGGEEFAVFLPETDVNGALSLAEDMRQAVSRTCIDAGEGRTVSLTVSIGIACSHRDSASVSDILNNADHALYAAKRGGRNRSMVEGNHTLPV